MRPALICLLLITIFSCRYDDQKKERPAYFDIATYFNKEALRLSKNNLAVNKTVWVDGKKEQKNIIIKNWEKEFEIFIDADINKASWKGFFSVNGNADEEVYVSNDKKIPVKKVIVKKNGERITAIQIFIHNTNDLYNSQDSLSYFPDSLYHIKKTQKIKLLSERKYEVTGRFQVK
jgi:hypothetical protein